MSKGRKWATAAALFLLMLAGLYFVGVVYFTDHFYWGTKIGGEDVSWKSSKDVEAVFSREVEGYALTVLPREGKNEVITAKDVSLQYVDDGSVRKLVKEQDRFLWPVMLKRTSLLPYAKKVSFDRGKAEKKALGLSFIAQEGKSESKDAFPKFDGERFVIVPEVYGTIVDKTKVVSAVADALSGLNKKLDLAKEGCYIDPKWKQNDPKLIEDCQTMNRYLKANVTYQMSAGTEVVDRELILDWICLDENMTVTLDEEGVKGFIESLAEKYNQISSTRYLTTPDGRSVSVSCGLFGWVIDEEGEADALVSYIKAGKTVTREPVFNHIGTKSGGSDWGDTFVELDLTTQHMWCIIHGLVAMESDVVTGMPDGYHNTPAGVHHILSMSSPAILVGNIVPSTGQPEYRIRVEYWMQMTSKGVGFHDATWQPRFGGDQYLYTGSHGCINMPFDAAAKLYSLIYVGIPVVIHY